MVEFILAEITSAIISEERVDVFLTVPKYIILYLPAFFSKLIKSSKIQILLVHFNRFTNSFSTACICGFT
jgi:hypothetical protein